MARRSDLPRNPFLARDIKLLERHYGAGNVFWDKAGRWMQINTFVLRSPTHRFNMPSTYVIIMVPKAYGERSGKGAGLEEFYVHRGLRILRGGEWQSIPHLWDSMDRRRGAAVGKNHTYACCHINWRPRQHTVLTALKVLGLFLSDPWTFERI